MKDNSSLEKDLRKIVDKFSLDHFPSKNELCNLTNSTALCSRIERSGGYIYWANRLGLSSKKPTSKWTEDIACDKIEEVINYYRQDYFPTVKQIRDYFGNDKLTSYISRTMGFRELAKRYNLPMKNCESLTGWHGEDILQSKLESMGYNVEKQSTNCPYDFVVNQVRIDCKYSKIYYGPSGSFYSCNLETKDHDCDLFCLICEDDEGNRRFLVIPNIYVFNQSQISVGLIKSKWDKFENRFDFIDKYKNFYKELI